MTTPAIPGAAVQAPLASREPNHEPSPELEELRDALDEHALVTVASADGTIVDANDRFCVVTKYRRDELIGRNHRMLNAGVHGREFWEGFWATIQSGQVWRGEVCSRAKDGSLYWVAATVKPLRVSNGRPAQYIAIRTDITERKRVEAELLLAKETADRANRAKSEFLAMMSHEIRTPMNAVLGFANLLLETPLSEQQKQFVSTICGSGQGLLALLNDILDFSKVEAGQLTLETVRYDLWATLDEVVDLLALKAQEKGLLLEARKDARVPRWLLGDPGRVHQVLLNLLGNAVKFTERGRIVLSLGVDSRDCIRVTVEDSGVGIDEEAQARLFRSFSQADASTTRRFGGTGLGLAISKRLVEMMGGKIGVRSAVGTGTTFWFTLPVVLPDEAAPLPLETGPAGEGSSREAAPLRVLVVEDNGVNQMLARHLLQSLSCAVDVAGNGREAIEMWGRLPYDLIFMDCHMPIMNGIEATVEIRRQEHHASSGPSPLAPRPRVTIIALTASAMAEEKAACRAAGMDDVVSKPISKRELRRCIAAERSRRGASGAVFTS